MFRCCYCRHYTEGGRLLQALYTLLMRSHHRSDVTWPAPQGALKLCKQASDRIQINSLSSDLKETFTLRLHRYLCKRFGCSEGGRDTHWSRRGDAIARGFLNPHRTPLHRSFHYHMDNTKQFLSAHCCS